VARRLILLAVVLAAGAVSQAASASTSDHYRGRYELRLGDASQLITPPPAR
jgi:hypothetical protein